MWLQVNKETNLIQGYIEFCIGEPIAEDGCELVEVDEIPENWLYNKYIEGNYVMDLSLKEVKQQEEQLNVIRFDREIECFPIINRGTLWYSKLTEEQLTELNVWYQAWLDAPATLEIPTKPEWIK